MVVKDHVAIIAAPVAIVFIMQRLVYIADEMNHEFDDLSFGIVVCVRVFQDGKELSPSRRSRSHR